MNRLLLSDGTFYPPIFDICHCLKCNEIVYNGKKYIDGHESIGRKASPETRKKQSDKQKSRKVQPFKNHTHSDRTKRKLLISSTKLCFYDEFENKEIYPRIPVICYCMKPDCYEIVWGGKNWVIGHQGKEKDPWNKGIPQSPEANEKNRKSHLRENNYNFGKHLSESTKLKQSKSLKGKCKGKDHYLFNKHLPEKTKQKISENHADMSGENNPCYIDGRSYEPYCHKFNNKFKESIRERDERICQLCSKTQLENGEKLTVHHVHYDKKNCEPDCVALCRSCNCKVNFNRSYYESFFMNKLNERGLLLWSKYRIIQN